MLYSTRTRVYACVCVCFSGLLKRRVVDCFSCHFKIYICPSPTGQQDCGGIYFYFSLMCLCVCFADDDWMRAGHTFVLGAHYSSQYMDPCCHECVNVFPSETLLLLSMCRANEKDYSSNPLMQMNVSSLLSPFTQSYQCRLRREVRQCWTVSSHGIVFCWEDRSTITPGPLVCRDLKRSLQHRWFFSNNNTQRDA